MYESFTHAPPGRKHRSGRIAKQSRTLRNALCIGLLSLTALATKAQGLEGIIVEPYYSVTQADADAYNNNFGGGSFPLAAGMNVYRVYVDMAPNYKLNTVFGSPVGGGGVSPNPLDITTTTTFWNDDNFGSEIPGQTRRLDEGTAFDSYITVNSTGTAGGAAGCGSAAAQVGVLRAADTNGNLTLCTAYPSFTGADGNIPGTAPALTYNIGGLINFSALTGNGSVFQVINDAWATLPNSTGLDPAGTNRVLIGQFTTNGTFSFHLNVQLSSPSSVLETYVWNQAGAGEVVSPLLTYPAPCVAAQITSATSNSPICSLDPLNLSVVATGTAPLSYTWSGVGTITNGNTASASVTGAATGNYNIAVSNACGNVNQNVAAVVNTATNWYADTDGDGFGAGAATLACTQPVGSVANNTDLCPADPLKQAPGACGCGVADVPTTYYADVDGDGFGDPANSQAGFTCNVPSGFVTNNTDDCPAVVGVIGSACNDNNPNTNNDVLNASCVCAGTPSTTITGCSSSQSPYMKPVGAGNTITSLLTVGDQIGSYKMAGIPDGMGAFDNGNGTFTLLMNHEIGVAGVTPLGIQRAHGSAGAFVSKWTIDKTTLCIQSGSDLIQTVQLWNGTGFTASTTVLNRLCSADLPAVSAFYNAGTGKGTQERIFMNGEESGNEGRAFGHIVTGAAAGTSYQLPYLGRFSWENALACPVAQDKTIVIGTDDTTPGQVYVYIGTKQSTGTDIEKAGLQDGNLYGIAVSGLTTETNASFPATSTAFTLANLGNVSNLTGAQVQTNSVTAGITQFLRPEDASWDPNNPNVLYFVTTNSFTSPSRLYKVTFTNILQPELGGSIVAVLDGTEGQKMLDNITVDQLGNVYLQEDPGNQAYIAKMWKYNIATDVLTNIAYNDSSRFLSGGANFLTQDEENSGIIDMQDILGAGKYLFNTQAHYATTAELVEGGQLELFTTTSNTAPCQPVAITAISGAQTLCSLEQLALNVATSGTLPISYTWSGTGSFVNGTGTPSALVNSAATGTYTVSVSNACGTATGNVLVTVNAAGTYYADVDGDSFGDAAADSVACTQPVGYVANSTDLCPADPLKQAPGACGCGVTDVPTTYYADVDGDGFGDPASSIAGFTCIVPAGYVANNTDNCPAVAGVIGSTCDDGNVNTTGDVLNASCVCVGQLVDCLGVPGGSALPGTSCDDNNAATGNDVYGANCVCAGQLIDCLGVVGGSALPGTSCDDGLATTGNDVYGANCVCAGQLIDCLGVAGGSALPGTSCNDGLATTGNDVYGANCVCAGQLIDCLGVAGGSALPGTSCNDNNANTGNDVYGANCVCAGQVIDCLGVIGGTALPGTACNDNNANTINDVYGANCACAGTPIAGCDNWTLEFTTDNAGSESTWQIINSTTLSVIGTGGPYASNTTTTATICIPAGACYRLTVTDANGMSNGTTGGFVLRDQNGKRVLDNAGDGVFNGISQAVAPFCSPVGNDGLIASQCDKVDWIPGGLLIASPNSAVSAQYGVGTQNNDGYEFRIFNPDGGYDRTVFISHANPVPGAPAGPTAACYLGFSSLITNPVPQNVLLNVRVRSAVNGVFSAWGPACRFKIDAAAASCPLTKLITTPGSTFSCGVTGKVVNASGATGRIYAQPVTRPVGGVNQAANAYLFELTNTANGYTRLIGASSYTLVLSKWFTAPLLCGTHTYNVRVRASFDGGATYCPWGAVCTVGITNNFAAPFCTAPSAPAMAGDDRVFFDGDETSTTSVLSLWPNPNNGEQLYVTIDGLQNEVITATVDIFDMVGHKVATRTIAVNGTTLNTVIALDASMASGMYVVNVTAGEESFMQRLVIQ